jgi:hypothetical protein
MAVPVAAQTATCCPVQVTVGLLPRKEVVECVAVDYHVERGKESRGGEETDVMVGVMHNWLVIRPETTGGFIPDKTLITTSPSYPPTNIHNPGSHDHHLILPPILTNVLFSSHEHSPPTHT